MWIVIIHLFAKGDNPSCVSLGLMSLWSLISPMYGDDFLKRIFYSISFFWYIFINWESYAGSKLWSHCRNFTVCIIFNEPYKYGVILYIFCNKATLHFLLCLVTKYVEMAKLNKALICIHRFAFSVFILGLYRKSTITIVIYYTKWITITR